MNGKLTRMFCAAAAGIGLAASGLASAGAVGAARTGPEHPAAFRTFSGRLYAVAATSPRNAWAVGLVGTRTLIVHWNGRTWTKVPSPNPGPNPNLEGVAATSARDAWAVGRTGWDSPPMKTLILHWNGRTWTRVPSPTPTGAGQLQGVAVLSPCNAWAVGNTGFGETTSARTLIEHWNGRAWKRVPSPTPGPESFLLGVAAISARNIWAVGQIGDNGPGTRTLIEHWNGRTWKRVPSPTPAPGGDFYSVAATSARNVWAVGHVGINNVNLKTLIEHWNGRIWTRVPSPTPGRAAVLQGVAATSARSAWAVGQTGSADFTCAPKCVAVILHWTGTAWKQVPAPNPPSGYLNTLWSVAPTSGRSAWAVGTTDYASTLIVRWNGRTWK